MNKLGIDKLVLASGNAGKLREFQAIFAHHAIQLLPQSQFRVSEAEETGLSFIENAILKARHAAKITGLPALADDSGLAVDALHGKPGIYSARFAGDNASDEDNNQKLLQMLSGVPDEKRSARFHCALALVRYADDPTPLVFSANWEGHILHAGRGDNGFGYDPLFFADEQQLASAELDPTTKNRVSHRARAVAQLIEYLDA